MSTFYSFKRLMILSIIFLAFTNTSVRAQGPNFFPQAGQTNGEWFQDVFGALNFIGSTSPIGGGDPRTVSDLDGLTYTGTGNDFTGLKLTFSAYVASSGASTRVVLASDNVWGGSGIVIEINKFLIAANNSFGANTDLSSGSDASVYQGQVRQDQYNAFVIDVGSTGLISVKVNNFNCPTTYAADVAILQASGSTRFTMFATGFSKFQMKNLIAERNGVTKNFFTAEISSKFVQTSADWTIDQDNELNFVGTIPTTTPAIIETTFGGLVTPTATTNDFTGLTLTFNAYISSDATKNTYVVLSGNGSWNESTTRGYLIAFNRNSIAGGSAQSGAARTTLSDANYPANAALVLNGYNSFSIIVSSTGVITIQVNNYICPTTPSGGGPLTASAPNPRYAYIGTEFAPFEIKNITATKNSVTKSYFVSTLPITLASFKANKAFNGNILTWVTASEANNSHFEVLRAGDDLNFVKIATVKGLNKPGTYNYLDNKPANGNNYYKLIQYDFNGDSHDLGVRALKNDFSTAIASVYPNPTSQGVNISLPAEAKSSLEIFITDLSGRTLQKSFIPAQSNRSFYLSFDKNITSGMYLIKGVSKDVNFTQRLLIN